MFVRGEHRYITELRYQNGTGSVIPARREIHHNYFLGTYNSQENMDNDDGEWNKRHTPQL